MGNVQHDQPNDGARERFIRHPIRPAREEATHLIEVVDEESTATLAIVATRTQSKARAASSRSPVRRSDRTDELTRSSNRKENAR